MKNILIFMLLCIGAKAYTQRVPLVETIPFAVVDEIPITHDCKPKLSKEKLKKCVMNSINMHVNKNFNAGLAAEIGLSGRIKITNTFTIDTEGHITDINIVSPNERLNEECVRVIKLLPKMIPGKQNGKPIHVAYQFPIVFNVQD